MDLNEQLARRTLRYALRQAQDYSGLKACADIAAKAWVNHILRRVVIVLILPPRTSWLYKFGISLSPTRRYLFTLLFMTICSAVWFYYVYEPLNNRIDAVQRQVKTPRSISVNDLKNNIETLRAELSTKPSTMSGEDPCHAILGHLDHAGLALEQCSVQDKTVMVQALGSYKQILIFFEQLAAATQRLLPRDVRITSGPDDRYSLSVVIETT